MQNISSIQPIHPQYLSLLARHNTFGSYWSINLPVDPSDLVLEGFFYIGKADWVVCYSCGVGLKNITHKDNIHDLHVKESPLCQFILKIRPTKTTELLSKSIPSFHTLRKTFQPKENDFVMINNMTMNSTIREMQEQLTHVKTRYRSTLTHALENVRILKRENRNFRENMADLTSNDAAINKRIRNLLKRFECPICHDDDVNKVASCGHVYCESCSKNMTQCAMCRKIISKMGNLYI